MTTKFHKDFDKQFAKLSQKRRYRVIDTIDLFLDDPMNGALRNHSLTA